MSDSPKPQAPATEPGTPEASETLPVTPTPPETPPAEPEKPQEGEPEAKQGKAGQEAAKYRTQLRAAESERDTLAATADNLRKALIAKSLPSTIAFNTELFWKLGEHTPADFFGADGALDVAKLEQAARATMNEYHVGRQLPEPISSAGTGGNSPEPDKPSWSDAMGKR